MSCVTLPKAIGYITLSCLPLTILLAAMLWLQMTNTQTDYVIEGLRLTASTPLPPRWAEEVLALSTDKPLLFSQFDPKLAEQKLLATHVVEKVSVRLIKPHLVDVSLKLRQPIAQLGDFSGVGVDKQGYLFPLSPLFTGVRLPTIFLGKACPNPPWGQYIATDWLQLLLQESSICSLDLSNIHAPSLGQKELIIKMANDDFIRTFPEKVDQAIKYYKKLSPFLWQTPHVVDLRLSPIAFVRPYET